MTNSLDINSYNFNDPKDVEKFFLSAHADLMAMYSRMSHDIFGLSDWVHQLDLYTIDQNVLNSLSQLVEANFQVHQTIVNYFNALIKIRDLNLLNP